MAKREYSNGYYPKIQYWTAKLVEAVNNNNLDGVENAHKKLAYFIQRQRDTKVKNVIGGVDFTQSLQALNSL